MQEDLRCHDCREREADYLLIWKKVYRESGREGWFRPSIICRECADNFKGRTELYEEKPHLISFYDLARYKVTYIGWLLSSKNKEANQLNNKFWRAKVWRIKKLLEARLMPCRQQPMAL